MTVQLKSESRKKKKVAENTTPATGESSLGDNDNEDAADKSKEAKAEKRDENDGSAVFVAALADSATDEEIMMFFSKSGRVVSLRRCYDKKTKAFTGAAFIQYDNTNAAQRALAFNRKLFHNRPLRVEMAKQKTMK